MGCPALACAHVSWTSRAQEHLMADETRSRRGEASRLFTLALVNGVIWGLCMIALIFVMQRSPSAKRLFVTMAVGFVVAS